MDLFLNALIVPAAVFLVLGLLSWAARRGLPGAERAPGTLLLRHSAWLKGFALFAGFGIPLGLTVLVFVYPPKDDGDVAAILGVFTLFAALSAPILWESLGFALVVSPVGLECRSPWRGTAFVAWEEVQEISYNQGNAWFIVHAVDGYKFRISILVPGVSRFLAECERHLPFAALARAAQGYALVGRRLPGVDAALDRWGDRHLRRDRYRGDESRRRDDGDRIRPDELD